jgi:hypothetical protein
MLLNPIFWTTVATIGSAFRNLRFEVAGMAFHPYIPFLFLLIFRAIPRLHYFPGRIGRPGAVFLLLYIVSLIQGTSFVVQLTKISIMAITMIVIALSVKSYDDFVAGALGLGVCAAVLCVRGISRGLGSFGGINPIDGAQKNAFSLFYLPGLALCLFLVFSGRLTIRYKTVFAILVTVIFAGVALSKNRSGWLASAVLLLLVFSNNQKRLRVALFIAVAFGAAWLMADLITADAEPSHGRDAVNAAESDRLRMELVLRALAVGFQNPILGVSPTRLGRILGTIATVDNDGIDCHNLTGYLIGGSGLFTFGAFCLFAYAMFRPPKRLLRYATNPLALQSARILSTLTVVWVIRSQFQEDVLFSSTFTAGLGLCIGLCIVTGVYDKESPHESNADSYEEPST